MRISYMQIMNNLMQTGLTVSLAALVPLLLRRVLKKRYPARAVCLVWALLACCCTSAAVTGGVSVQMVCMTSSSASGSRFVCAIVNPPCSTNVKYLLLIIFYNSRIGMSSLFFNFQKGRRAAFSLRFLRIYDRL